jgi:hypothetical protein
MKWLAENWIVLLVLGWVPALFVVVPILSAIEKRKKLRDPNTVLEEVEGKRYIVTIKEKPLVRHIKSGRRGVLLQAGWERDPDTVNGRTVMKHRWLQILPLTGKGGIGKARWVNGREWEVEGTTKYRELDPI